MDIIKRLVNEKGETYELAVKVRHPGWFVYSLWKFVNNGIGGPDNPEQGLMEWTDRLKCVRTTVSGNIVQIRTHGHNPEFDTLKLHQGVLAFVAAQDDAAQIYLPNSCTWQYDPNEYMWASQCGDAWVFSNDDDPAENHMNFCPFCGGKLLVKKHDAIH